MSKSEKFWDSVAKKSGKRFAKLSQTAWKTVESIRAYLSQDDVVLDFGCGPGTITQEIASRVQAVEAMDLSSGMIDVATRKAEEAGIANVRFVQASLFDERYKKEAFDAILAFNILHYLEELPKVMQRINTLLKPGGLFISSIACLRERTSSLSVFMALLTKTKVVPTTTFYRISDVEGAVTEEKFDMIETKKISRLPECFMVATKKAK